MKTYITDAERDGDISPYLEALLNRFIRAMRSVFSFHCFLTKNHSKTGYHPKGMAADGHMVGFYGERIPTERDMEYMFNTLIGISRKRNKTIFEQAMLARLSGLSGIGMYPHWNPAPGLHLDCRDLNNKPATYWVGLNKEKLQKKIDETDGDQIYIYL